MIKLRVPFKSVPFVVALAITNLANATSTTTDWGSIDLGETFTKAFTAQRLGDFEDFYKFSLSSSANGSLFTSITITLNGDPHTGFEDLSYDLYTGTNQLVDFTYNAIAKSYHYGLTSGSYYLKVAGNAWVDNYLPPPPSPSYNGYLTIASSVPEPQTYAMLLAGLGILGTVIRRRNNSL